MTNPPGAMPPLPENAGWQPSIGQYVYTADQLQAYAAPLIARVAELERQNEAQKDEWLSWDAKRAALEKDAARYRWIREASHIEVSRIVHYAADELDEQVDAAIAAKD